VPFLFFEFFADGVGGVRVDGLVVVVGGGVELVYLWDMLRADVSEFFASMGRIIDSAGFSALVLKSAEVQKENLKPQKTKTQTKNKTKAKQKRKKQSQTKQAQKTKRKRRKARRAQLHIFSKCRIVDKRRGIQCFEGIFKQGVP
jgi:mannitol-specific phosphotransferase system IIBC component